MDKSKKKITIVTVCSLILVAMVVALVIVNRDGGEEEESPDVSASRKAITTICDTTDYRQTCVDSLKAAGTNTTDPQELIRVVFQAAMKYINEAAKKSTSLQKLETDPRAKSALRTCGEVANHAVNDLRRSFAKFNSFDITNVDDILLDLKTWLSGALTHQETCLDGFVNVSGDAGQKMRNALEAGMQMTSNALAMVEELSTYLEAMGIQSFQSRRLLSEGVAVLGHGDELPDWMDFNRRKLLTASPRQIKPNLIVAKDGSGHYKTINEALKHIPKKRNETFVLYVKEGVYEENVKINSSLTHLLLIGDGPTKTRITGNLNYIDGVSTYHTATVAVQGDNLVARDIGFENSAGPEKHQAVALRVSADKAIFYNCRMDGYQDTLYAHTYRQFYRDCVISGTIDFIFGDSAAVLQGCTMLVRKPLDNQQCIVTAQGRKDVRQPTGLVLQNCTIKADDEYYPIKDKVKSYLGRPWKEYSRTIIMESFIDDLIQPEGWLPWNETFALETLFYTEFNNKGPAAPKTSRVKWPGVKELPPNRIQRFTAAEFVDGNRWIPPTHVPYASGFIFPVPKEDPNINYSRVAPEENKDLGSQADKSSSAGTTDSSPKTGSQSPFVSPSGSPAPSTSPFTFPDTVIIAPPLISPTGSPGSVASSSLSPSGESVSVPQDTSPGSSPTPVPQPDTAASPSTYHGGKSASPSPIAPRTSSISFPQPNIAPSPHTSPSSSPVSAPETSIGAPYAASPSPISTSSSPVSAPETSIGATYAASPSPISTSSNPVSSLLSSIQEMYGGAPPTISPSGIPVSTAQSDVTAPPQSSYSYADAQSFS